MTINIKVFIQCSYQHFKMGTFKSYQLYRENATEVLKIWFNMHINFNNFINILIYLKKLIIFILKIIIYKYYY